MSGDVRARVFQVVTLSVVLCFVMPLHGGAQAYSWVTIAGVCGTNYAGSADGTNSGARFNNPRGLALDGAGNLYVADGNRTIRKMTPMGRDWVVSTIAGATGIAGSADGTNAGARFWTTVGMAWDGVDRLYMIDATMHTIRRLVIAGTNCVVTTIAGWAGVPGSGDGWNTNVTARFNGPMAVAVDPIGNVYVADSGNNAIRRVSPSGTNWMVSTIAGRVDWPFERDGSGDSASFANPCGIAIDGYGSLFVADFYGATVRKMTLTSNVWWVRTIAGGNQGSADGTNRDACFYQPGHLTADGLGGVFVTDCRNNNVRKVTPIGTNWVTSTIGGLATNAGAADGVGADARFDWPVGVVVGAGGEVYVADTHNHSIRMGTLFVPVLQWVVAGKQLVVSWPTNSGDYVLERKDAVPGGAAWVAVSTTPAICGAYYAVTNEAAGPSGFYRLRKR